MILTQHMPSVFPNRDFRPILLMRTSESVGELTAGEPSSPHRLPPLDPPFPPQHSWNLPLPSSSFPPPILSAPPILFCPSCPSAFFTLEPSNPTGHRHPGKRRQKLISEKLRECSFLKEKRYLLVGRQGVPMEGENCLTQIPQVGDPEKAQTFERWTYFHKNCIVQKYLAAWAGISGLFHLGCFPFFQVHSKLKRNQIEIIKVYD